LGYLVLLEPLIVGDDAIQSAANIADSETGFRLAISSLLVVAGLDVVVAWALFRFLDPESSGLSMLAALFRVVYAGIFVVAIAQLVGILRLLPEAEEMPAQVLLATPPRRKGSSARAVSSLLLVVPCERDPYVSADPRVP